MSYHQEDNASCNFTSEVLLMLDSNITVEGLPQTLNTIFFFFLRNSELNKRKYQLVKGNSCLQYLPH